MKSLILFAAACAAVIAITASPASAKSQGLSCSYKMQGFAVYTTFYGSDNSAVFCRLYGRTANASKVYYTVGAGRCLFRLNSFNVYARIDSVVGAYGNLACDRIDRVRGWTRIW